MIAGCILEDSTDNESVIVFLGEDNVEVKEFSRNKEAIKLISERKPEIIAFNVGTEKSFRDEFTEKEEELKDEGFIFRPNSHEGELMKRLQAFKQHLFKEMAVKQPEVIRFEPQITAEELAINTDKGLESYGIETEKLESSKHFDAMLGAVTARFYQENNVRDYGVIVPGKDEE